jgi:hypothetical protein
VAHALYTVANSFRLVTLHESHVGQAFSLSRRDLTGSTLSIPL